MSDNPGDPGGIEGLLGGLTGTTTTPAQTAQQDDLLAGYEPQGIQAPTSGGLSALFVVQGGTAGTTGSSSSGSAVNGSDLSPTIRPRE